MQVDRMFEIVYLLLEKGSVTARELSERFEVSTRTIYRDVENLSASGIPVYMARGQGGGIRLMPEFVLDRVMLSAEERTSILSALESMRAVEALPDASALSKLRALFRQEQDGWIEIDFGDWGEQHREQFDGVKRAILEHRVLEFDYLSREGIRTLRRVEPMQLWFKERTWYLRAYCLGREAMRLFRLSRMRNVHCTARHFIPRELPTESEERQEFLPLTEIRLCIAERMGYRALDEFRDEETRRLENGDYEVTMRVIVDEWVYGYILSFGSAARVLSPDPVREEVRRRVEEMLKVLSE